MHRSLACTCCSETYPLAEHYTCPGCRGELDVTYDHDWIKHHGSFSTQWRQSGTIVERFADLMPLQDPTAAITMGEGNTPLIRAGNLARRLGLRNLYLKLECCNPTGSFKDRQVAIGLSKAREFGRSRFATVSSGNVGNALAAYAARANNEALIWVSQETETAKLQQILVYGAKVFSIMTADQQEGADPYYQAFLDLSGYCERNGLTPMISARRVNPFMVEGAKTIAYEIGASLNAAPDVVFAPIGGGGLVGGLSKGFRDLRALGLTSNEPALLCGQREPYFAPIAQENNPDYQTGYYHPLDGHWAAKAIEETGGSVYRANDTDIRHAQRLLAQDEGIFAEPRGAYAAAAMIRAAQKGSIDPDALTVCIVSGMGLKDMSAAAEITELSKQKAPVLVASLAGTSIPLINRRQSC